MKPRQHIKRYVAPRKKNARRLKARSQAAFGWKGEWIRTLPCVVREQRRLADIVQCRGDVEAAHIKSRACGGDSSHLIPLCRGHHAEQHWLGIHTFAREHRLDLTALAEHYETEWRAREAGVVE